MTGPSGGERNRPAREPGGCDCHECGAIFIGEEWHTLCGVCHARATGEELLAWLAGNRSLELSWCEVDGDMSDCRWCIHQVRGGYNDREWTLIATGETPHDALFDARRALTKATDTAGGGK